MKEFKTEYLGIWCKNCIIFTSNKHAGNVKLVEIVKEKESKSIYAKMFRDDSLVTRADFDDGECWTVVRPSPGSRGIRWDKVFVDATSVTIAQLEQIIKPFGDPEKLEFYNWY